MLSEEILIELNKLGIIPGPEETEEEFQFRSKSCLEMKKACEDGKIKLPFSLEELSTDDHNLEVLEVVRNQYDIFPIWVPIFFSNKSLLPWHGGSTWIFFDTSGSPQKALIQLNQTFKCSKTLYWIYTKEEILVHEMTHIGRIGFDEPIYEEMIAYSHSPSKMRRFFGPMLSLNWKKGLLIFFLFALLIIQALVIETLLPLIIALLIVGEALFLNGVKYLRFKRALLVLSKALQSDEKARHVIYRLTDDEINICSSAEPEEVIEYFSNEKDDELRKQIIFSSYFQS